MDIQKLFKGNRQIIGLAIVVLVVVGIVWGIQRFSEIQETYREYVDNISEEKMPLIAEEAPVTMEESEPHVKPVLSDGANIGAPVSDFAQSESEVSPEELLPKSNVAAEFEEQFPVGDGDLTAKNFLTAGYHVGINTVSSSLRNANLGLRSDPYIPPKQVSPFLQSTILPDMNRKPLDIGS